MVMSERRFYGCNEDAETLTHTTPEEAIEDHLDLFWPPKRLVGDPDADQRAGFLAALPETIEVMTFEPMKVTDSHIDEETLLQYVFERLEEDELGDPDGREFADAFDDWKLVQERAKEFVELVRAKFKPWACEEVARETINVKAWIAEHKPEWLA
jgi:hypothetical protein